MCSHRISSAFNGYIAEIPFIFIDNFENQHQSAYFLSHYHADHTVGLTAADLPIKLKENKAFIYASEVTIAIIKNEICELSPYLKSLSLGRNVITICKDDKEMYLNVTALPAGHSLGSIMLLFECKQTILYTGDFRITANDITKYTHLHKNGEPICIDVLYIDTTFQNVHSFPRRSEVVSNVIVQVENWIKQSHNHRVILITSAAYGYENICNEVYSATQIKTYIPGKWDLFSQFPKEMYGITDDSSSRIHLITKYRKRNQRGPEDLCIYFSAMKWESEVSEENFMKIKGKNEIEVCFATHCGRDELLHFVNYLQPKRVIGFPQSLKNGPRLTPSKMISKPLSIDISPLKKMKTDNKIDGPSLSKKVTQDVRKRMFDW